MKKLTSKSASANPKTSSLYGTSAQTGVTAKEKKVSSKKLTTKKATVKKASSAAVARTAAFQVVTERVKEMTPAEFRKSLVKAGIISGSGKLTSNYKVIKTK
jgi:hypothetical protein